MNFQVFASGEVAEAVTRVIILSEQQSIAVINRNLGVGGGGKKRDGLDSNREN